MNRRFVKAFALPTPPVVCQEATGIVVDPMRPGVKTVWGECEASRSVAAKILGRKGGLKGGHARAAKLSPKRRAAIARKAARTRWKNQKAKSRMSAKSAKPASTD